MKANGQKGGVCIGDTSVNILLVHRKKNCPFFYVSECGVSVEIMWSFQMYSTPLNPFVHRHSKRLVWNAEPSPIFVLSWILSHLSQKNTHFPLRISSFSVSLQAIVCYNN